jgi:serine phosphatase RsbU (regulator of sigma subunit)
MLLNLSDHSPEPLRSQIARQLRSKVLRGDLVTGNALPPVHVLARAHRVPALAAAQAYEALAREGVVEPDERGGYRVAGLSTGRLRELAQQRLLDDLHAQGAPLEELELARDIQRRLLPPAHVSGEGYAITARSFPARFVTGDFYDVIAHADGSVGVVVADVAGKGLAASLVMASVKAMIPFVAAERSVEATMAELNARLAVELGRRQFVALAYARYEPATGIVELANAGLPDPLLVRAGEAPVAVEVPGVRLPLGARRDVVHASARCVLTPGDRLLLFTDGIPEARRGDGAEVAEAGLVAAIAAAGRCPLEPGAWLDAVLERVEASCGPVLDDDWTAVALEAREPGRPAEGGQP